MHQRALRLQNAAILGLTELGTMLDEISFNSLIGVYKHDKDRATLDSMKSKTRCSSELLYNSNGVTNESLPEFVVKSTDIKHPIRVVYKKYCKIMMVYKLDRCS
jgi:hypothetical protein